jgi:hypothetical protein
MGEWDPSLDIAIALEEKLGVNRKSLMKKYDKLLGIPRRKCSIPRKQSFIAVVTWEPLSEAIRKYRKLLYAEEE